MPVSAPSCPPLLASRFAENQTAWRRQGRFIFYCSRGGGFGSWLRGLGSAFAISILAERALILDGACEQLPTAVAKYVAEYFQGNGFNWTVGAGTGQRAQVERRGDDRVVTVSPICRASVRPCGYSRTMVQGQLVADSTSLELHAGGHALGEYGRAAGVAGNKLAERGRRPQSHQRVTCRQLQCTD